MGGGNGGAITLQALKQYADRLNITGVISTSDSGGSSGKLRKEFNTLPPGDILRAVLALAKSYDYKILKEIFYKVRFEDHGRLSGHNLGNIFLILTSQYDGNFINSIRALEQAIDAAGSVHPVCLESIHLCAELSNGYHVKTEAEIDEPKYDRKFRIKKVWLEPEGNIYTEAAEALKNANHILLGPGSLYTSIIATLLVKGVREAVAASKASLIFIPPQFYETTKETGPTRLSEMVREIEYYLPRPVDMVLYDGYTPSETEKKEYEARKWALLEKDVENIKDREYHHYDLIEPGSGMAWKKLSVALKEILFHNE